MNLVKIISAVGNNSSIYPLLLRDCGIENPTKVYLTYKQNRGESKDFAQIAARERFFDEYIVSSVWLGGIPIIDKIADFIIDKTGNSSQTNLKLIKGTPYQSIEKNIEKFKNIAPENIIKELDKLKKPANIKKLQNCKAYKFIASTAIPIAFMGVIIPKMLFKSSTKRLEARKKRLERLEPQKLNNKDNKIISDALNKKQISFKGQLLNLATNFSTVEKMAITDGGYALGRLQTARNKNERIDISFKMLGMMLINYVLPKYIAKSLDTTITKATGLDVTLDPLLLDSKEFINKIKTKTLKLPKENTEKSLLEFIDTNINSIFVRYAEKMGKIKLITAKTGNKIRDPRFFIEAKELANIKDEIERFVKNASKSKNIEQYCKNAIVVKSFNIMTNVILSSVLLAYTLPKAQFLFRRLVTGSKLEPGLIQDKKAT